MENMYYLSSSESSIEDSLNILGGLRSIRHDFCDQSQVYPILFYELPIKTRTRFPRLLAHYFFTDGTICTS